MSPRLVTAHNPRRSDTAPFEKPYKRFVDAILFPICWSLSKLGVSPNLVTNFRMLLAIVGVWMVTTGSIRQGSLIIALSLLLDSIDGGIARLRKKCSDRGTFIDRVADLVIYCGTVFAVVILGNLGSFEASFHVFIVFAAIILKVVAANEFMESDWIINPKANLVWFMIAWYATYFAWALIGYDIIEEVVLWLNILLTVSALQSYITIQHRWYFCSKKRRSL